jgi:hypothetical protein
VTPTQPTFVQLNPGWNAEPNAPSPAARQVGKDVFLEFFLNPWKFPIFSEEERGILRFNTVTKFRLGATNDEGWYLGQCRYSKLAPAWGNFYEIKGHDPLADAPDDWRILDAANTDTRHFLFYFRDETFEAMATDWCLEPAPGNALTRLLRS